jgi:VanZ family protein
MWWLLGGCWILLLIFLSLANISYPQVSSTFGDKINHALAYGLLMGWFGQLMHTPRRWWGVAIVLVLLGMVMEALQSSVPYRSFDVYDGVANAVGVLAGLLVLYFGGNQVLKTGERWLDSIKGE